jgi:pilus assembly protein CpaB
MNQRLVSVLAFALIVSTGASLLLYRLLAGKISSRPAPGTTRLVVAAHALEPGTLIRDADLAMGDWQGSLPPGAFQKKDELAGRGVLFLVLANEPVVEGRLAPKGAGAGLAALIPKGMRAVAVRVNEIVGVAGFVLPGMRVDVLISGNPPGEAALGGVTKTLLQNIQVLSAGQNFQKDTEGKPISVQVVNLLVTPEQAEKLSLAGNQTSIQLVLRNPLDTQIAQTPGSALVQLFRGTAKGQDLPQRTGRAAPAAGDTARDSRLGAPLPLSPPSAPLRPPPPKPRIVEVILGAKRTETSFGAHGEVKP